MSPNESPNKLANDKSRVVTAVHGLQPVPADAEGEVAFAYLLKERHSRSELMSLYDRFASADNPFDASMRRVLWRALVRSCGSGVTIASQVTFRYPETFDVGEGVFIGAQSCIQGRYDGHCEIGRKTWIGPQVFLDARDLKIGEHVGIGPGAKILGSVHTGLPHDVPVIQTDLVIKPVSIDDWADIGMNASILPGISIGRGAIVGAGAVVTHDVPDFAIVAGNPARLIRWRDRDLPVSLPAERNGIHP